MLRQLVTLHVLIFVFSVHISCVLSACDYMQFGDSHTMCKYTGQGCKILKRVFSDADKAEAVKVHNVLRQKVATGNQTGQPGATNMKEVKWDDELATIAQRWADQCIFDNDKNQRSFKFEYVGQIADLFVEASLNVTSAVESWYNEVTKPGFDKKNIDPFMFQPGTEDYTMLVWANIEAIGCGYSSYISQSGMNTTLVICNYGPPGNVIGASMYKEGKACSKCDSGECSTQYPGLCATS